MFRRLRPSPLLAILLTSVWLIAAQQTPSRPIEEIIRKFAENEKAAKSAWEKYTYREELRVQEMDRNSTVGELHRVSDLAPVLNGKRIERILSAPPVTLKRIALTREDLEDMRELLPFALTNEDIQKYDIKYSGTEKVKISNCFVFEVKPKRIEKGCVIFRGKYGLKIRA